MTKRERKPFSKDFTEQVAQLHLAVKPRADIVREYNLTLSDLDRWSGQHHSTCSFQEKDNRTPEEAELIQLRKENQRLMMENDILNHAALIMGRK